MEGSWGSLQDLSDGQNSRYKRLVRIKEEEVKLKNEEIQSLGDKNKILEKEIHRLKKIQSGLSKSVESYKRKSENLATQYTNMVSSKTLIRLSTGREKNLTPTF